MPCRGVPNLDTGSGPDDRDIPVKARVCAQRGRDRDASLLVRHLIVRAGEEHAQVVARLLICHGGGAKWFVESFSVYQGLSNKVLDVKQSSGNGLGKSDGVSQEEVLAFLSGQKHKIGFLEDRDVIRSGAAQEIPGEVLEQLAEEEADVAAWIQAE